MKKILVSIVAVIYLTSSVVATVHLHFCMDKLINWSLLNSDRDKCDKCGMKKDDGCCKDEDKFVKNNIDQKITESAIQVIKVAAVATPTAFLTSEHYFSSLIKEYPTSHAPPRNDGVGIYILNCVFSI